MKTRIYLGEKVEVTGVNTNKIVITFLSGATVDNFLQFNYYPDWPDTSSDTPRVLIFKTVRDSPDEVTIAADPNEQAFNYVLAFNLDFNTAGEFTITRVNNVVTITANNGSELTNLGILGSFATIVNPIETTLEDDYKLLDLYEDENIEVTSKLSDIEKLSNVFLDFSNSFTIPATSNNNDLFQHYYDVDIDNTFNANIRVDGYIEIDSFPFRFGKIQLEGITLKNQRPENYKITFYGSAIQLTDLFGEDTINRLDYKKDEFNQEYKAFNSLSQFDYRYSSANFVNSLNLPTFNNGQIITPLISYTDRNWNYGTANILDISTNAGAIIDTELRPAIRIANIINGIETKYGITFSEDFFRTAVFNNLFMWMNNQEKSPSVDTFNMIIQNPLNLSLQSGATPFNISYLDQTYNIGNTEFGGYSEWIFNITVNEQNVNYDFLVYDENDNLTTSFLNLQGDKRINYKVNGRDFCNKRRDDRTLRRKFVIRPYEDLTGSFDLELGYVYRRRDIKCRNVDEGELRYISSANTFSYLSGVKIENNLPKLKVIDFLQGLMKMFKLIIRPTSQNSFYIDTLNSFYDKGNILDITPYVNTEEIKIERPLIYKEISFKYQKTNNVAGETFREINDPINDSIGYGDLQTIFLNLDNTEKLKIELPFENMLFERLDKLDSSNNIEGPTNYIIGQSISTTDNGQTFSKNNSKPILFFNNGIVGNIATPFVGKYSLDNSLGNISYNYLIGNTNDEDIQQVTNTINFGAEIDPWHGETVEQSLFQNYWADWIDTIYSLKQRKFTFNGYLPPRYIEELSLNDRIIIGNNRYKINDYKINLLNGKTQLTLFNDIYDWNLYTFPSPIVYNERSFSPNGWYITDTIDNGDSAYIYGSFTGYNSTSYGRIVKLLPNGDVDTSFNTGTGFNSNLYGFQSIHKQNDGKILATGDFTSFSGTARNRIARLNTDGSLDTSLVVGTGFNSFTSGIDVDSQGRIIVCGSYDSYSGVTSQRIIRLTSGGTINYSTSTNGFNNVTNSVVINSDDSIYVGGYFSTYSGITSNRIIKLTSGFTVDSSFNVGAGLNSNTSNQPVGLVSDVNDGVYAYGYFTTYSGISANRLVRLLSTGQINEEWFIGTGFNNTHIFNVEKVLGDKLLVRGEFTQFNGLSVPNGFIVLNADGSIYRTFTGSYVNVFTIGNRFYGNLSNGPTVLIGDETINVISTNSITANASVRYYGVNVLKKEPWSVTKVDLGFGTNWITILNDNGNGLEECTFRVDEKVSQSAPTVYEPRFMTLRFNFAGVIRDVLITQNGLEE